ncbi:MAG TPA: hypothetical protein PLN83_01775 [Syntrophorhabdus sp.]|nr:hypothetical protein [Syntrophorhabdus sp.]
MMKKKGEQGRIERYVESRLWKCRLNDKDYLSREQLLKEIQKYFLQKGRSLKGDPDSEENFKRLIERCRMRVRKKWSSMRARENTWAGILHVTQNQIHALVVKGYIKNKSDVKKINNILEIVNFRR